MTLLDDVREYYADLLILQYRHKPKARETVKMGVDIYTGDGVLFQLPDILNIDVAVGAQLDIIGKILGCPRNIPGLVVDTKFFQFHVDENSLGFSTVGHPSMGVAKSRYNSNLATYALIDDDYRQLLKYKAYVNRLDGTMAGIDEALYNCFGDDINLRNNQDSTITYEISNNTLAIQAARKLGYFRAPVGVGVSFETSLSS